MKQSKLIAFLFFISLFQASAFACGGIIKSFDPPLSPYMKQILENGTAIPLTSNTLRSDAGFAPLFIAWHNKDRDLVQTGTKPTLDALNGAHGYVMARFVLNSNLRALAAISNDIATAYPTIKDDVKLGGVRAELQFIDTFGRMIARHEFDLNEGNNNVKYCDFDKFDLPVREVRVELKSYSISFQTTRTWNWQ